ncbi:10971_t:CDS:1 [Racocetra persica]|uniref:10971_t:CDS:1 n=1 Tax=Racocetra persica TaxID=160502 RepID=A0ACA9RR86_9GLOM|nr:10971_t:CDS:1 [Racocetra persica]
MDLKSKEQLEKMYEQMRKIKKKMIKANDYKALLSICRLTLGDIADIIERKLTEEEEWFIVENYNGRPRDLKDLIPYNRRIVEMFISRFPINRKRILAKLDSCPFTSDN